MIALPFLGVLIYLIANGKHLAECNQQQSRASRAEFGHDVTTVAAPGGAAIEIERPSRCTTAAPSQPS